MQSEISTQLTAARRHARSMDACRQSKLQAIFSDQWRHVRGEATDLLRFEDIAKGSCQQKSARRVQVVPLRQIVGSVGRRQDFTRDFLPRRSVNLERWARIHLAFVAHEALPLVELYQVGNGYFVVDGHHRISVARARGFVEIEANVMQVQAALTPTEMARQQSLPFFARCIASLGDQLIIYGEHLKTFASTV